MATFDYRVMGFGDDSLVSLDWLAFFRREDNVQGTPVADSVDVERPFDFPTHVGVTFPGKAIPIHLILRTPTTAVLAELKRIFRYDLDSKYLYVADGDGRMLRMLCTCGGLAEDGSPLRWVAKLWAVRPLWESTELTTVVQSAMSGDVKEFSVTPEGNASVRPKIRVKPRAAKLMAKSYRYFSWNRVWSMATTRPLIDPSGEGWPILLRSGWNTASIIKDTSRYNLVDCPQSAPTIDASSYALVSTQTSKSWSHTVAAGNHRFLIVTIAHDASGLGVGISTVTYGGVALTHYTTYSGNGDCTVSIWYLVAPAVGAADIAVTFTASMPAAVCGATSWQNVDPFVPFSKTYRLATGTSTTPSASVSGIVSAKEYCMAVLAAQVCTATPNGGQTELWNQQASGGGRTVRGCGAAKTGDGTVVIGWTLDPSRAWTVCLVTLQGRVISDVSTEIEIDSPAGGGLATPSGMAWLDSEQVAYTGNEDLGGGNRKLTGCSRGIGGTAKAYHVDNTPVYAGEMLANGDDVRLFLDGVEVDRWLDGINTAATKVWANIPYDRTKTANLKNGMTPISPADGGMIQVTDPAALVNWSSSGYFVCYWTGFEVTYYGDRTDGTFLDIKRAMWGTSKGSPPAGAYVFYLAHDIRLLWGRGDADAPLSAQDKRPMFNLTQATNTYWAFPSDYMEENTRRTGQWQRLYIDELDSMLLGYEQDGKMQVEDATAPVAGKPKRNIWCLKIPIGVNGASAITHDISVPPGMLLRVYGNDGEADVLLAEYNPTNDGSGLTITPPATIYDIQYRALLNMVCGCWNNEEGSQQFDQYVGMLGPADPYYQRLGQEFVLDEVTLVTGFVVPLRNLGATYGNLVFEVWPLVGGTPSHSIQLTPPGTVAAADIPVLPLAWTPFVLMIDPPIVFQPGTYVLGCRQWPSPTGIGPGPVCWGGLWHRAYSRGLFWLDEHDEPWASNAEKSLAFMILDDASVRQRDSVGGTGNAATVGDVSIVLDDSQLLAIAGNTLDCYYWNAVLENLDTGQWLWLRLPMRIDEEIEIDCEAKTVRHLTNGESVEFAVEAGDPINFFSLLSGQENHLRYTELGMTNTDLTLEYRDCYQ